jgi:hypothetical protein
MLNFKIFDFWTGFCVGGILVALVTVPFVGNHAYERGAEDVLSGRVQYISITNNTWQKVQP